jgi:hypothetical protein
MRKTLLATLLGGTVALAAACGGGTDTGSPGAESLPPVTAPSEAPSDMLESPSDMLESPSEMLESESPS